MRKRGVCFVPSSSSRRTRYKIRGRPIRAIGGVLYTEKTHTYTVRVRFFFFFTLYVYYCYKKKVCDVHICGRSPHAYGRRTRVRIVNSDVSDPPPAPPPTLRSRRSTVRVRPYGNRRSRGSIAFLCTATPSCCCTRSDENDDDGSNKIDHG